MRRPTHRVRQVPLILLLGAVLLLAGVGAPPPALAAGVGVPKLPTPEGLQHAFADTTNSPSVDDFNLLAALRLLLGDAGFGGPARPADALTRAEFAALALRMRGLASSAVELGSVVPSFRDAAQIPPWAWGYVNAAQAHGLINGYDDGTFRAADPVHLAEALAIMSRLLGRADEVVPGLAWPDSYLELGVRTGLSGRFGGFGNLVLDRAALAHLAATALATELEATGSGITLLTERFGFGQGEVSDAEGPRITCGGEEYDLAAPYLWTGVPLAELAGERAEWLTLPESGAIAFLAPAYAARWSQESRWGFYADAPGPLAIEAGSWWDSEVDAALAWTLPAATAGSLSSSRVRLAWPARDGAPARGFVLVAGTTTASQLFIREPATDAAWVPVAVDGGRFRQLVYLSQGRGPRRLQFMTPAPGSSELFYPDLSFTVNNELAVIADPQLGAAFAWPRGSTVEAAGYVDVAGSVPTDTVYLQVTHGQEYLLRTVAAADGRFAARIWLNRGPGEYAIRICVDDARDDYYRLSDAVVTVRNVAATPDEWTSPGVFIQSGDPAVRALAAEVTAGSAGDYERARSLYAWLTRSLAYDVERASAPSAGQLTTNEILARGKGVCEDYANVFAALCRACGIPARVAVGEVEGGTVAHAWNEFLAGDRWVSVDATWGAGYVRNGVFRPAPTDEWFDRDLSSTHVRQGLRSDWHRIEDGS